MHKKIWKNAAACLLAALMFPGCSDDEGGGGESNEDKYRTIVISLNSMENSEMGTRAETVTPDHPDSFDEHFISRYWLVVLKQDEGEFKVDRVIDSDDPEYTVPDNTNDNSRTELGVEVEVGQTYRFYALANLDGLKNGTEVISALDALKQGDLFDPRKIINATVKDMDKYPHDAEGQSYIPMTSYGYDQKIEPKTTELDESIALIRLIGKATVTVENLTENAITVNSLSIGKMRKGDIFLFPYDVNQYDNDGNPIRCLFLKSMVETYMPSFPTNVTGTEYEATFSIPTDQQQVTAGTTIEYPAIYLPETSWTDNEDLTITATITGRNPHPQSIHTSFLRRNDWLKIPIQITPVTTTFNVEQQHMPIGGIPEEIEFKAYNPIVPIISCTTDHAGKITVTFEATVGTGSDGTPILENPVLLTNKDEAAEGIERTGFTVKQNDSDVLLVDRIVLTTSNTDVSGTLELTLQELSKPATAKVELLLVMVQKADRDDTDGIGPDDKRLAIPYTIQLTFDNTKTSNP